MKKGSLNSKCLYWFDLLNQDIFIWSFIINLPQEWELIQHRKLH